MTSRILSQHGNVIAADFRPRRLADISVRMTSETLYCDGHVTLIRATVQVGDRPASCTHLLGDLATGHIVQL
ncbi:hypothetical protein GobsT_50640 [Gemmata obscuriglobus]|uniref:Uncharacterized protein n=1 Tax=Gemmata obscuriglobus TaxID=114 RepID=A0A2Z3H5W4_9BACT|nr:hypothetical protein [Gemmata obscuriglobus]AWM37034.1 hypothetical protein C1280_08375 [Gemmata obscuriglobus]QEG30260.1 hypothetical protein GobsT_50640 [Gemmata obscuriglobus]VTS09584.1 unnamed protein product [Gemmata obscuriglobus UQM 2246]